MSGQKEQEKGIDLKAYRKILNCLELRSLQVDEGKFSFIRENMVPNSNVHVNDYASYEIETSEIVSITHIYKLMVKNPENRKKILGINVTYKLSYHCKEKFPEDFFDLFKDVNLPINTWPFFREFVSNITSRMNIPPLTLPLLKKNL